MYKRQILDYNGFDDESASLIMKRYMSIIYEPFMSADNVFTHNIILDISEMARALRSADQIIMCKILTRCV